MSRETANAARYAKGLTVLTELEGELLEALDNLFGYCESGNMKSLDMNMARKVIKSAHGE